MNDIRSAKLKSSEVLRPFLRATYFDPTHDMSEL